MSDLRDEIAERFDMHYEFGIDVGEGRYEPSPDAGIREADRILALIVERVTSEAAIIAAIGEMSGHDQALLAEWTHDRGITTVRPIIEAALEAAGVVKGGDQ